MAKSAKFCLLVYGTLSVLSSHALAIDLQPNDIVAPTPDRTAISISYVNAQNTTLYVNNVPTGASPNLESNLGIVRLGHTYTIGSLPAVSYVQVGGGTLSPDGSLSAYPASQGMTDTTIATAIWPYANHTTRTYFGVAAYLSLPTGEYSSTKAFNLGNNRYSQALQLGYQRPITKSVDGAFAFDTVWYGANSQCAAACSSATNLQFTQKPLYSSQIGPIYRINQTYTVAATYVYVTGGETAFNGIERNNTVVTQRYFVSGVAYTKIGRFMLQYG
ncbi:MAG: transporter, partial [Burkholderiaceae bacterium]|nr:transporter [Burkholderiaceae bacterium]